MNERDWTYEQVEMKLRLPWRRRLSAWWWRLRNPISPHARHLIRKPEDDVARSMFFGEHE